MGNLLTNFLVSSGLEPASLVSVNRHAISLQCKIPGSLIKSYFQGPI